MEIIKPDNFDHWLELRTQDITSTEVSALFGLSPYTTEFELWHRKKSKNIVKLAENERMTWGKRLESVIAEGTATDQGWEVTPFKDYAREPALRVGSSFDYMILQDGAISEILEIKNVDYFIFKDTWIENDTGRLEAPPHIELQVQHQLGLMGMESAKLVVLVGGNKVEITHIDADPEIFKIILDKVEKFWKSIDDNKPPAPNFIDDAGFIADMFKGDDGKQITIDNTSMVYALANKYKTQSEIEKNAKLEKAGAKAEILMSTNGVGKILHPEFTVSNGKSFRINWRKKK